ncbi:MAG: hypothetical protein JWO22_1062 [Frankiales bacterium]|nr:hypothetical protein [Frankiales bacterium]
MTSDRDRVQAAYRALPESHRQVLHLAQTGHSYVEIAGLLGVAPSMVRRWALHATLSLTSARVQGRVAT